MSTLHDPDARARARARAAEEVTLDPLGGPKTRRPDQAPRDRAAALSCPYCGRVSAAPQGAASHRRHCPDRPTP